MGKQNESQDTGRSAAPSTAARAAGDAELDFDVGNRLREIRKRRRLTLDALAQETGFTKGYLSKIERGHKIPPIASLARISRALGADVADLLQAAPRGEESAPSGERISVVRAHERQKVIRGGSSFGYDYQALAHKMGSKHMQPFLFTFPAQLLKEVYFEHEGEEMIFILSGKVEFEAAGERVVLSPGDCLYFDSTLPHRGRGINGEAKALVVVYNPEDR